MKSRGHTVAEMELDEKGFVDMKGEEKEAESSRWVQRAELGSASGISTREKFG